MFVWNYLDRHQTIKIHADKRRGFHLILPLNLEIMLLVVYSNLGEFKVSQLGFIIMFMNKRNENNLRQHRFSLILFILLFMHFFILSVGRQTFSTIREKVTK